MLPTMKIGDVEVTKLIVGSNPFTGKSHMDEATDADMKSYFSEEQAFAMLRRCEEAGINAVQSRGSMPVMGLIDRYRRSGGKLLWLAQSGKNLTTFDEELDEMMKYDPAAVCIHGELADNLYLAGMLDKLEGLLDKIRRKNVPAGICAHFPQVLEYAQEKGLAPDYYMASLYNLSQTDRSHDVNPEGERFEESDIPVMYNVIRQLEAPTFALKILGAGRRCATQEQVRSAFVEAFCSMKPTDGVLVGMFDKYIEQPRLNAEYTLEAIRIAENRENCRM
ncbi:MAG: hypothetical protein IJO96_07445 [Oscillospiraceae bacterium]|nr:hypothetical protein [Oscillospiraceae bacterium]